MSKKFGLWLTHSQICGLGWFFLMMSAKMMTSSNNWLGENISNVIRLPQAKFEDLTLNSVEAIWISHLFKATRCK